MGAVVQGAEREARPPGGRHAVPRRLFESGAVVAVLAWLAVRAESRPTPGQCTGLPPADRPDVACEPASLDPSNWKLGN